MAGFIWAYNLSGGPQLVWEFVMKDTEHLTVGDLLNIESSFADLAATNDATMLGPLVSASDPTTNVTGSPGVVNGLTQVTKVKAGVQPDALMTVEDANARLAGVTLDIAGATGAQTVATDSNHDVFVVKDSSASELTLVKIAQGEHFLDQT